MQALTILELPLSPPPFLLVAQMLELLLHRFLLRLALPSLL